ncbi:hypothetical protein ACNFJ7_01870 [Sphingomonas sp. HT-1]|uniref:hypothetical protein n=1 Tax=unclassified Sphingomonas TaxID=196159 RepID=UPI00035FA60B|nr:MULTISPECIES: hypothetical protein [unclassified Sphingomonas]KTF68623.1 hypothetical protein ATB93_12915 [Sphingomonas sp. WG]
MSEAQGEWSSAQVRTWLERRIKAARADQDAADRYGRDREDDYDKAAAEEWVCEQFRHSDAVDDQAKLADALKALLAKDDFYRAGVRSEQRFEREVKAYLRKLAKMTKTNTGFGKTLRYQ